MAEKTSPEYAMLPAGTITKWGKPGDALAAMKPLDNCKALGAMGQTGGFVDCTTLRISKTVHQRSAGWPGEITGIY
jgi:hypothetical protein